MQNNKSKTLYKRGIKHLVGAVNSPVRAFGAVGGNPIFITHGAGAKIYDADGNEYIDYVGSYGPLILGHAYPKVLEQIKNALDKGFSFGSSTEVEIELAELIKEAFVSIDLIRFVNSGTEAVLSAMRLARAYSQRNKIVKFAGCYHGHSDNLLVQSGSGVATLGLPGSAGVPKEMVKDTLVAIYNDIESVQMLIKKFGNDIAAIIIEPVAGNMGVVVPEVGFMQQLRKITEEQDILLIIDEVMTGFRSKFGGAQDHFNISGDIICLGKVIGGGFPVGAYGARKEIMEMVAPLGPVYQAGTLSGNPIAMTAGIHTLKELKTLDPYAALAQKAAALENGIKQVATATTRIAEQTAIPTQVNRFGSMLSVFFTSQKVTNFETAQKADSKRFAKFFWKLIENGIYIPPSGFESWFLSAVHTDEDIERTLEVINKAYKTL